MTKTWSEVVDELAWHIENNGDCEVCPAMEYCDSHPELAHQSNHGCYCAIVGWAKKETGDE